MKIDPGQAEQVVMNLAVNARDAMPDGGRLTIETANVVLDKDYFRKHGTEINPGHYVMLAVTDTGTGIDRKIHDRIFEPFFTTKGVGRGTGLGLSTVYGIAKQNNGYVLVYSEPGEGTTFKIYLPRIDKDINGVEKEQLHEHERLFTGSETILAAEDDESIRSIITNILEGYGYKVITARNGEDALEIFGRHDGPVHMLLTDVVMPGMNGRELAEQLKSISKEVKVIYMSGYTDNVIAHHNILRKGVNFIQKPFTPETLAAKVREVLNNEQD